MSATPFPQQCDSSSAGIAVAKRALRRQVKAALAALTPNERAIQSQCLMQQVEQLPTFIHAKTVMAFSSLPDEVQTFESLSRWAKSKTVLLPVVSGDDLILRRFEGPQSLRPGAFGILEPVGTDFTDLAAIDVVLVPALAFDTAGHRLGRGRGYYDRFLSQPALVRSSRIGVCYPCQLVQAVPTEAHDLPVAKVIATL